MHEDVDGAFYTVRLPDGAEKQTTRSKLDSLEERAEAAASALLDEEAREEAREAKRGGKGKGGAGSGTPPERKPTSGKEKKRK